MTRSFSELHLNTHGLLPNGHQNMDCAKDPYMVYITVCVVIVWRHCHFLWTECNTDSVSSQKVLHNGQHGYVLKQGLA